MKAADLGRYLLFDEDAIRRLAADRASLPAGAALVLMTTIAREYDERDLVREVDLFAVGLALSLGVACVLHVIMRLLFRGRWTTGDGRPDSPPQFFVTLAMVWLTAPLAWIYALPVERWCDPLTAAQLNVGALALVALWRVLLLTRVAGVLTGAGSWGTWRAVLVPSVAVFAVAVATIPGPVLNLMGGARLDPHERFLAEVKFYGPMLAMPLAMALTIELLGTLISRRKVPARVRSFRAEEWHGVPRGFLIACVVGWGALAAVYQPQVRRALALNRALDSGDVEASKSLLAAIRPEDWPPRVALHPDAHTRRAGDALVALLRSGLLDELPPGHWYRAAALDLLGRPDFVWLHTWSHGHDGARALAFARALAGSRAAMAWLDAHPDADIRFNDDPGDQARAVLAPFFARRLARLEAALAEHALAIERAASDWARARATTGAPDPAAEKRIEAGAAALSAALGGRWGSQAAGEKQLRAFDAWIGPPAELLEAFRAPVPAGTFAAIPPKYGSMVRLLRTAYIADDRKRMRESGVAPRGTVLWPLTWALESGYMMNAVLGRKLSAAEARKLIADSAPLEAPGVRALIASCEAALVALGSGPAAAEVAAAAEAQRAFLAALPTAP